MPKHMTYHGHKGTVQHKEAKDGSREIFVWHEKIGGQWKTHSTDLARAKYEESHHTTLSKDTDVDHKDNDKSHNGGKNLQAMSHGDNVAKENMHRVGRQFKK